MSSGSSATQGFLSHKVTLFLLLPSFPCHSWGALVCRTAMVPLFPPFSSAISQCSPIPQGLFLMLSSYLLHSVYRQFSFFLWYPSYSTSFPIFTQIAWDILSPSFLKTVLKFIQIFPKHLLSSRQCPGCWENRNAQSSWEIQIVPGQCDNYHRQNTMKSKRVNKCSQFIMICERLP